MIIKQEKSNEELDIYADRIIKSLANLNIAEKYKVIACLHTSLSDTIMTMGAIIEL